MYNNANNINNANNDLRIICYRKISYNMSLEYIFIIISYVIGMLGIITLAIYSRSSDNSREEQSYIQQRSIQSQPTPSIASNLVTTNTDSEVSNNTQADTGSEVSVEANTSAEVINNTQAKTGSEVSIDNQANTQANTQADTSADNESKTSSNSEVEADISTDVSNNIQSNTSSGTESKTGFESESKTDSEAVENDNNEVNNEVNNETNNRSPDLLDILDNCTEKIQLSTDSEKGYDGDIEVINETKKDR